MAQEEKNGAAKPVGTATHENTGDALYPDRQPRTAGDIDIATDEDLGALWQANPEIKKILKGSGELASARKQLREYLNECEKEVFSSNSALHPLEKANVRECIRVFKSIIGPINEKHTQFSALEVLWLLAREELDAAARGIGRGFVLEFVHLFKGVAGKSGIYELSPEDQKRAPEFLKMEGREAALERSRILDGIAAEVEAGIARYPSGLLDEVVARRVKNKNRILKFFKASEQDWLDCRWQISNVIRDASVLSALVQLCDEEREAVGIAVQRQIPFGITPYYLSLMDAEPSRVRDHAIRSQVIPPLHYVRLMERHGDDRGVAMDFMGEHDTSPVDLVTRRYPKVAILKPYDTCAQICVYCQRNWEIEEVLSPWAAAPEHEIDAAVAWFKEHPGITDVLITGGDPLVMSDEALDGLLGKVAALDHVRRIRLGTRTPVVLPQRYTDSLVAIFKKYHQPGKRELCVVTHFEHPYEITPEAMSAVSKTRGCGIGVYNQEVFTFENSRRFESVALRETLRVIGVDPYYTFSAKGKEETREYRVPIARILQECKEESRLLPGLSRTDEPVFNVPRLGKNNLRAWQDHRVVMIMPDGRRVYEFHPWEKYMVTVPSYNHYDVPIYDYLKKLKARGEDPEEYKTIWYYF